MKTVLICWLIPVWVFSQKVSLDVFENLVNKTWVAEGTWGDGSNFKQELIFSYDLNGTIITADSYGFVDKDQKEWGKRAHGVRQVDVASNTLVFWEFDVFGNMTTGTMYSKGKDIYYQYRYGEVLLTDMWKYVNDATYSFIVGELIDGEWKKKYLETTFTVSTQEK
ncbi:hypothetical protein ACFSTE_06440 [Aquimarina hainanensis]|uniref:DUF1579 domain-containing protein n=1 Tax=Aquimarina hainanensis TaxID=1578017 RepID=A0ABW5N494_9FLAO|nr:hypothetical protein [Aquimarina sp. TRL1]QKX04843.1 hypothetical protein HN014_07910 [Aquimarina sp. TRL1]